MKILHTVSEYRAWHTENSLVAFIPTMGNLHAGHLSLVKQAKSLVDKGTGQKIVVSIFVNPLQFAPHEDFDSYPRTLTEDAKKLENTGAVDVIFAPSVSEMYPHGKEAQTQIIVPEISKGLCGDSRPHFFQGVATVVCKLFNCIQPSVAIFGEKDYQQLLVIKKMVADLNLPIEIIAAPIVREQNGLAMSSRNQYLAAEQKQQAGLLYQSLQTAAKAIRTSASIQKILADEKKQLSEAGFKIDYYELRDSSGLKSLAEFSEPARLFIAAYLGNTRLIDNIEI